MLVRRRLNTIVIHTYLLFCVFSLEQRTQARAPRVQTIAAIVSLACSRSQVKGTKTGVNRI